MKIYETTNGSTYIGASYENFTSNYTESSISSSVSSIHSIIGGDLVVSQSGSSIENIGVTGDAKGFTSTAFESTVFSSQAGTATASSSTTFGGTTIDNETFAYSYSNSTSTSTMVDSEYTTTQTSSTTYISGETTSLGSVTTYSSTQTTTVFTVSDTTTTVSTWITVASTFTTLTGSIFAEIGTVFQCESPFEVIWVYSGSVPFAGYSVFSSACYSTSIFTYYSSQPITSYTWTFVSTSSTPTHAPFTQTTGANSSIFTQSSQTFSNETATVSVKKTINGLGDIPYSTSSLIFGYKDNFGNSTSTSRIGVGTSTQTSPQSNITTFIEFDTVQSSYSRVSNNEITTTGATDFYSSIKTYLLTQSTIDYTQTLSTKSLNSTFSGTTTGPGFSITVAGSTNQLTTQSESRIDVSLVNNTNGLYFSSQVSTFEAGNSVIMRSGIDGVEAFTTSFNLSNGVYENYQIGGDFSYIYYTRKSTALLNGNEGYVTFSDVESISFTSSDGNTKAYSYLWSFDSSMNPVHLNVTSGAITSATTLIGTSTVTERHLTSTMTGTVTLGVSLSQATTNIYGIETDGSFTNSVLRVGGFGVNTSFPVTCELWDGVYFSTGYTYSSDGSLSSSSTNSSIYTGYNSVTVSSNVMSIIQQLPVMINSPVMGASLEIVNTFDNSDEMP